MVETGIYTLFPFLIGRIRTKQKNMNKGGEIVEFPFLIGRIRTLHCCFKGSSGFREFPFIIGRIRTEQSFENEVKKNGFPFLIGRIRTICKQGTN